MIAGAAGQKIGTAAAMFCRGAILAGLWATQQNDYPVTVKTGHSTADVILSPQPVLHLGITDPDVMIVLFSEGLAKERARIGRHSERGEESMDLMLRLMAAHDLVHRRQIERVLGTVGQ